MRFSRRRYAVLSGSHDRLAVRSRLSYALCALFWLGVWHIASVVVGQDILLVSPLAAAVRLFELSGRIVFWQTVWFSLTRIMGGFVLALVTGILLASLAVRFKAADSLFAPLIGAVKSVPVASYTILCLVFLRAKSLPLIISLLMSLPVVYENIREGLRQTDIKLLEMAKVFRVPPLRRIRMIYIPQCLPYLVGTVGVAIGIAWKSGVAAELIGLTPGSIGTRLYEAKFTLDTRSLFAWTIAVMLLCFAIEKLTLLLVRRAARALERW